MVGDKLGEKQSSAEHNKSLIEDNKRLNKQIQYLTENTAATLKEKILIAHELDQRNQELEALGGISQAIIQLQAPDRVMDLTINKLPRLLGVDDVGIFLWNNDAEVLTLTCTNKSIDKELAKQVVTRKLGQGLVGMVAKTRQPFYTPDVAELSTVDATPTLVTGVKAFAAVPIATSEKLLGVLTVSSPGPWECTKHRIDVLSIIGNLLAASLENARLYQDSQNQVKRQRIMYKLSSIINSSLRLNEVYDTFAKTLKELVSVDRAVVTLVDETEKTVNFNALSSETDPIWKLGKSIPTDGTGTAWVVSQRKSLYQADLTKEGRFWTDETLAKDGIRSIIRLPLISKNVAFGCLIIGSKQPHAYNKDDRDMLEELAGRMAMAISNNLVYEDVSKRKNELENAFSDSLRMWVQSWEARYLYTKGHSEKVFQLARKIAQEMGFDEYQVTIIETAARLHDIGLITVPDEIMQRQGNLSFSEKSVLEQHPQVGADMLHFSPIFKDITPLIRVHHERYDGKGFPRGLRKDEIPMGGRILAIAEDYVLMSMELPSRKAFTLEDAKQFIAKASGSRYDPQVVQALLKVISG
ncbi:MAG: GAF domain-containing protein [Dehalococcoidia bacterium]|nr:GAF domain-containing protein [Dehalococcoidia bacterium]